MEPIPPTFEALRRLGEHTDADLVAAIQQMAQAVVEAVPDAIGLSVTLRHEGTMFTLISTADELRVVDATQYLDGGPCQVAASEGDEVRVDDILDEDRWQMFAQAGAARGVRSSLSIPLFGDTLFGSINLYGSTSNAFDGVERELTLLFGSALTGAVANADLSMSSMQRARDAPALIEQADLTSMAIGVLAERHLISVEEAKTRLFDSAERAGISHLALAQQLVETPATDGD